MRYYLLVLCIIFLSCNNLSRKNNVSISRLDTIWEGKIISDSIFDDTIRYYNLSKKLLGIKVFKNGKLEGVSTEFYENGNPFRTITYNNGVRNGPSSYYDSSGKVIYNDFCYYGLTVGPIIFYDDRRQPKSFFFSNLQNEDLIHIDYQDWKGIKDIYNKCINFTTNIQKRDTSREISLLLYLIKPPRLSFQYSILKRKVTEEDFVKIKDIHSESSFINIALDELPTDERYIIGLNIYDSILNKATVIYKDLQRRLYRYGFNGQEKSDEIKGEGNSYTAEYWEYDPRSGRRWNLDPKPITGISEYAAFNNSPIWLSDVRGDSSEPPKIVIREQNKDGDQKGIIKNASEQLREERPVRAFIKDASHVGLELMGLNAIDDFIADRINGQNSPEELIVSTVGLGLSTTRGGKGSKGSPTLKAHMQKD